MITEEIRVKIEMLRQQGLGSRKITKELNAQGLDIPLHHVNHYIHRKSDHKVIDTREAETKTLIKETNKLKKNMQNSPNIAFNANSMKSIVSFSEMQDEISAIEKINNLKNKLIQQGERLYEAMQKGQILDKDDLRQIRHLCQVCDTASNLDRNMTIKIKEIIATEAGIRQENLAPKTIEVIELSSDEEIIKNECIDLIDLKPYSQQQESI